MPTSLENPLLFDFSSEVQSTTTPTALPQPEFANGWRSLRTALFLLALFGLCLTAALGWLIRSTSPANILIVGVDRRADESNPARTDVIMVLHADLLADHTGLISVSRDLWLPQPNGVPTHINRVMAAAYDPNALDAGPRFLEQTLVENLDMPLHGYLLLDFDSFVTVVDAVGGVEVELATTVFDEAYPDPVLGLSTARFDAGRHSLDGAAALTYVRARHQGSDAGRAERQQQVLNALVSKTLQPQHWSRLPTVAAAILTNVQGDLSFAQILLLGWAALQIAEGKAETLVINGQYVEPWVTPDGAYAVLPRWDTIRPAIDNILHRLEN